MSVGWSRAWQMKHRGVIPSIESVILAFPWAAVAFLPPVELFAPPDCESPVKVAKHRRLLRRGRCMGSYGRYEYSRNSSCSAACNNPANQSSCLPFVGDFEVDEAFSVFEAFFEDLVFGFFCCASGDLPGGFFEDGFVLVVSEGPWRVLHNCAEVE